MIKKRKPPLYRQLNIVYIFSLTFLIQLQFVCVIGLQGLKIFVPEAVIVKNAVTLACQYDLGSASLYSVKWYFESEEFYRYQPSETPPARTFVVQGIDVDVNQSDATSVTLKAVQREVSGMYQCEISEDAPLFHTDIKQAKMQVVELPHDNPSLSIMKRVLVPSDTLKGYCKVGVSHPPANISWYINGRRIYKTPFQRITYQVDESGATSTLEVYPLSHILQDIFASVAFHTSFDVLCEVSIYHIYNKNAVLRVFVGDPAIATNLLNFDDPNRLYNRDPDGSALTSDAATAFPSVPTVIIFIIITCVELFSL